MTNYEQILLIAPLPTNTLLFFAVVTTVVRRHVIRSSSSTVDFVIGSTFVDCPVPSLLDGDPFGVAVLIIIVVVGIGLLQKAQCCFSFVREKYECMTLDADDP